MKQRITRLLPAVFSLLLLSSCGSDSMGTGVAEFKTVMVAAQAGTPRLESDILTANSCGTTGSTGGAVETDNVDVTVTSTEYPNFTGTRSAVLIDKYTVSYTPANSVSPALPVQNGTTTIPVAAGGSVAIDVAVVPDSLKLSLLNNNNIQPCSITIFNYYVTVTFEGLELNTGERKSFIATLNLEIADRI